MAVRIVTDSASDLPSDLAQRWNITVVPCYVIMGDQSYRDGVDISPDEFYRSLVANSQLPHHGPTVGGRLSCGIPGIIGPRP